MAGLAADGVGLLSMSTLGTLDFFSLLFVNEKRRCSTGRLRQLWCPLPSRTIKGVAECGTDFDLNGAGYYVMSRSRDCSIQATSRESNIGEKGVDHRCCG